MEKDIPYSDNGHERCKMDLYLPAAGEANGAAVFLIHGGGWKGGDRAQWTDLARSLAARGYVCASAGYRLVPEAREDRVTWSYAPMDPWHLAFTPGVRPLEIVAGDGEVLFTEGRPTRVDPDEVRAKAAEQAARLHARL